MKIKILYEDSNILAIDKPSGLAVHGDGRNKPARAGGEKTLVDFILKNYPKMKNVGEPMGDVLRPGIVHRLDRDTSGVMLLAKNQKTYEFLKKQFQNREIKKTYVAIVNGWFKEDKGIVNKPIGRSPNDFRRRLAGRGARGELKEAVTEYKVIKRFENKKNKYSYTEVMPKTGRTHQIRVHMKYLNHPVVCDTLYNPKEPCPQGLERMGLHAKSIEFKLPGKNGKILKLESRVPKEFLNIVK
jgi:23S rRNA pseudouridine1911/1915/1917 synthase